MFGGVFADVFGDLHRTRMRTPCLLTITNQIVVSTFSKNSRFARVGGRLLGGGADLDAFDHDRAVGPLSTPHPNPLPVRGGEGEAELRHQFASGNLWQGESHAGLVVRLIR